MMTRGQNTSSARINFRMKCAVFEKYEKIAMEWGSLVVKYLDFQRGSVLRCCDWECVLAMAAQCFTAGATKSATTLNCGNGSQSCCLEAGVQP